MFQHLKEINQDYILHFFDAIGYSYKCLKCSFYFLCHSIYPDIYQSKGSNEILELNIELLHKKIELKKSR